MGKNILVVGCGGLGCEIVKILSQDQSNTLTLIDDDTIDPTNLNRQFLFVKNDIGKSKAEAVASKISRLVNTKVIAYHQTINCFPHVEFYRQFDIVYNCLDNNEARSYVNQRCFVANVIMVDGGSAGWLGQSFINKSECFDCLPKKYEKTYPICSIRQRPKNFEHCLIWAKTVVNDKDFESIDDEWNEHKNKSEEVTNRKDEISRTQIFQKESAYKNTNFNLEDNKKRLKTDSENVDDLIEINSDLKDECDRDNFKNKLRADGPSFDLIYALAKMKATRFKIGAFDYLKSQTFVENIVPSICTTNSIIASLMILSGIEKANYYLVQGSLKLLKTELNDKRTDCLTCSIPTYQFNFTSKMPIKEFLESFGSNLLLINEFAFEKSTDETLDNFDGQFGISMKNNFKYKIYFIMKNGGESTIKRIK